MPHFCKIFVLKFTKSELFKVSKSVKQVLSGFSLHAVVFAIVPESHKLERLCSNISPPDICQQRLSILIASHAEPVVAH